MAINILFMIKRGAKVSNGGRGWLLGVSRGGRLSERAWNADTDGAQEGRGGRWGLEQ